MSQTVFEKLQLADEKKSFNSGFAFFNRKAVQQIIIRQKHDSASEKQENRFCAGICGK